MVISKQALWVGASVWEPDFVPRETSHGLRYVGRLLEEYFSPTNRGVWAWLHKRWDDWAQMVGGAGAALGFLFVVLFVSSGPHCSKGLASHTCGFSWPQDLVRVGGRMWAITALLKFWWTNIYNFWSSGTAYDPHSTTFWHLLDDFQATPSGWLLVHNIFQGVELD